MDAIEKLQKVEDFKNSYLGVRGGFSLWKIAFFFFSVCSV